MRRRLRKAVEAAVIAGMAAGLIAGTSTAAAAPTVQAFPKIVDTVGHGPAQAGFWSAYGYAVTHPNEAPAGANDFSCKPKAGQRPVILVHGTFENAYANWAAFAPALKRAGYCVFTPNYGRTTFVDRGGVAVVLPSTVGVGDIARSATQFGAYVDRVRRATGSDKVDVIGHSQGGLVARQWIKSGGGADAGHPPKRKIGTLITFGTPNHGTTLLGLAWIGRQMSNAGFDILGFSSWMYGAGAIDQTVDSPFIRQLNQSRETYPGIRYTVVGTRYDEVVTPYESTFLKGRKVENIELQKGCAADTSDHLSMSYSPRAISIALHALDPEHHPDLVCSANPWFFSF
ncbi:esterase/lipase family protein [Gordonia sp. DT218]|uniref:esterase/lipase family protein n=1 Tax=Gordonia sp. DT218 TaxID=3416659 RepID=UPI003CF0555F